MSFHDVPATLRSLKEVVEEYETKREALDQVVKDYARFHADLDMATTVGGTYVGRVYSYHPSLYKSTLEQNLLKSAWRHVYDGLNIKRVASAADRSRFDLSLENPAEFTLENIAATFGDYLQNPRFHILKGLAECFTGLDPAYRSHSRVKVGVNGLPKRIIINSVVGDYGIRGYGADRLSDTINALNVFQGDPHIEYGEFRDLLEKARKTGSADYKGLTLKLFKNGNGHLIFSSHKLVQINEALAEFYGDVLPDSPEAAPKKRPGTDVAKDLQFYPTPRKVVDEIIRRELHSLDGKKVLEPSCGEGAMMEALHEAFPRVQLLGIEVHAERAEAARAKGFSVVRKNFLETAPQPVFDLVLMNPPFYGLHWRKHLDHAVRFLRPAPKDRLWDRGQVVSILPASAWYDGHLDDLHGEWRDLPVASFAQSGTNVPTGYFKTSGVKK